jgi:hypothetical protein
MKNYTSEVEFLRDEVEKCHESMHSQIETVKILMLAHIELRNKFDQKRQWLTLEDEEYQTILGQLGDGSGYSRQPEFDYQNQDVAAC